jgi:hypothetical protein
MKEKNIKNTNTLVVGKPGVGMGVPPTIDHEPNDFVINSETTNTPMNVTESPFLGMWQMEDR